MIQAGRRSQSYTWRCLKNIGRVFCDLDDFERKLNEVKAVYDLHKSKVSEETLTRLHLLLHPKKKHTSIFFGRFVFCNKL